tara:strand:+ start:4035 stop:5357 length:1323 start_codon:yes stop_codon:yes gene_type:complete
MPANKQRFLSGENTNQILQEIIKQISQNGSEVDIKDLTAKIPNFMGEVYNRYRSSELPQLNHFVIDSWVKKYLNNRPLGGGIGQTTQQNKNLDSRLEQELKERGYNQAAPVQPQNGPGQPFDTRPISLQQNLNGNMGSYNNENINGMPTGGMSLNQAITGEPDPVQMDNIGPPPPPQSTRVGSGSDDDSDGRDDRHYGLNRNDSMNNDMNNVMNNGNRINNSMRGDNEIWLSLSKEDLVDVEGNTLTFCWNKKIINDFGGNFQVELKYVSIPKNYPYLLAKYEGNSSSKKSKKNRVYNALGKNYSAKLIPSHTSDDFTTYQALGSNPVLQSQLPSTLSFSLSPVNGKYLELNVIQVIKVVKTDSRIHVTTKYPHNLDESESLSLEFPKQHICYRITNLEILGDKEIIFNSPFSGYFSKDFRLLRNKWNIDLTLCVKYSKR